jgi:hypothetical protein
MSLTINLKLFLDSPDAGHPDCICSYCEKLIEEGTVPIRMFVTEPNPRRIPVYTAGKLQTTFSIPVDGASDDVTGNLPQAVVAYHNRAAQLMTNAELSLIIAYIQHYVHAPLWLNNIEDEDFREEILNIQKASLDLKTIKDVESIIEACMDVGWDPL